MRPNPQAIPPHRPESGPFENSVAESEDVACLKALINEWIVPSLVEMFINEKHAAMPLKLPSPISGVRRRK
jgi:hypothetical protein